MKNLNYMNLVNLLLIVILVMSLHNIVTDYEKRIQTFENKIEKIKVSEKQIINNHKEIIQIAETNRDYIYSCVNDIEINAESIRTILDTNETIIKMLKN